MDILNNEEVRQYIEKNNKINSLKLEELVEELRNANINFYKEQLKKEVVQCNQLALKLENKALKQENQELELKMGVLQATSSIKF